jgi:hypothetical protein
MDMIKNVDYYPEFKEVIIKHFMLKKEHILDIFKKWIDNTKTIDSSLQHNGILNKEIMTEKYNEIKTIMETLTYNYSQSQIYLD